jgi:hypothetical protein
LAAPAQAGPYSNGDDDDWSNPRMWAHVAWGCLVSLILIFLLIVGIIFLVRTVSPGALSTACDDSNECTYDILESRRGVDGGVCHHFNKPNEDADGVATPCTSACYDNPTCTDGQCGGTCKGHCVEGNALDCPKVSAVNLTALLGFGAASTPASDTVNMYRECVLSGCRYVILIDLVNATLDDTDFVSSVRRLFIGDGTNTTSNSSAIFGWKDEDEELLFDVVCMSLIHPDDRDCLQVTSMDYDDHGTTTAECIAGDECTVSLDCRYMFKCTNPPSYAGALEFPAKKAAKKAKFGG